jgi:hypothetical protein
MANLEVDADRLAKDGDEFNNLASVAYSIYGSLARAASLISFPADDKVSRLFSEQWNSLVRGTQEMLLGFRDGMTGVASNVFDTAALYQKSNIVNTESVTPPPTIHR